jgi:hypothetical protein
VNRNERIQLPTSLAPHREALRYILPLTVKRYNPPKVKHTQN